MAARNKDEISGVLPPLAALFVLGLVVARLAMFERSGSLTLTASVVVIALLALAGIVLWKLITRPKREEQIILRSFAPATAAPICAEHPKHASSRVTACSETPGSENCSMVQHLQSIDWFQFEQVVAWMFQKLGYAVTRRGGANPDGGIDLIVTNNGERVAVQCKHWKAWRVGVKTVREFIGALTVAGIQKGILITLRGYTREARELATKHHIEIFEEAELTKLLDQTSARYDPQVQVILSDQRKLCPKCEREMVLRTATKGSGAGEQFWGCSGFPRCRYTMPAV